MARVADFLNSQLPKTNQVSDTEIVGIGSFTLDVRLKEDVIRTMAAPTTPLENGSFANDHIIENPLQLQISGEVSEVKYSPDQVSDTYKRAVANVGVITKYLPQRTRSQVNKVFNVANDVRAVGRKIDSALDDADQILEMFGNKAKGKSVQELFIDSMDKLQRGGQLVAIQAQGRIFENMMITSMTTSKDNISGNYLPYYLVAQEMRFAVISFTAVSKPNPSKSLGGQPDGKKSKGINKPEEPTESLLSSIGGLF
jgi:hypothetical protein